MVAGWVDMWLMGWLVVGVSQFAEVERVIGWINGEAKPFEAALHAEDAGEILRPLLSQLDMRHEHRGFDTQVLSVNGYEGQADAVEFAIKTAASQLKRRRRDAILGIRS